MTYSNAEAREFIKRVVDESKRTANVDTGFLKRSIRGNWFNKKATFRQIFYGAYNGNSELVQNAERIMPNDIPWSVIFTDEEGRQSEIKAKTRTGRSISRERITSANIGTDKIKNLIALIKQNGSKKDDTAKTDRETD